MAKFSQWISQLRVAIKSFHHNYLIFPKYALLISVLISSQILAEKTVILFIYITDEKGYIGDLRGATLIVSVQEGVTGVMTLLLGHISIAYSGPFKMVLLSTLAYFVGIVLLWRDLGFYVAVFLIVVGKAGVEPLLKEFLATQLKNKDEEEQRVVESRTTFWWSFWYFFGSFGATFGMANIPDWETAFKITAILIGVGLVISMSGFKFYQHQQQTTSPRPSIYRVFKAAISKRHLPYPPDTSDVQLSSHSRCLRWLDKATITQEQDRKGELCTVTEVNEVKLLLRTIPMLATFPLYSFISIAGSTFFFEQIRNLDDHFGSNLRVTPAFFILVQSISKRTVIFLFYIVMKWWPNVRLTHTRIGLGVLCAFLCCITAWSVEVRRLKLVKKINGFEDKSIQEIDIPMRVFWLTPQFCLLGLMEGFVEDVLIDFFYDHSGDYMKRYGPFLTEFVFGISTFANMFWILTSWIGPTINKSRVDKCYLVLAILVVPNAFIYWCVSTYIFKSAESGKQNENQEMEQKENLQEDIVQDNSSIRKAEGESAFQFESMSVVMG